MNNTIQSKQRISHINSIIETSRFFYLTNQPVKKDVIQKFTERTEIYRKYDIIAPDTNLENMTTEKATRLKNSFLNWEAQLDQVQQSILSRVVTQKIIKAVVTPQQVQEINKREVTYGIFNAPEIVLMIKHFLKIDYGIDNDIDNDIKNFFSISTSFQRLLNKRVIVSLLDTENDIDISFSNIDRIQFAIFNQYKIHLKIRQDSCNLNPTSIEFINTTLKELIEIVTLKNLHIYQYGLSLEEKSSDCLVDEVLALSSFPNLISLNIGNLEKKPILPNLTNLQSLSNLTNLTKLQSLCIEKLGAGLTLRFEESPIASFYCDEIIDSKIKFIKCLNLHSVYFEKIQNCRIQLENLPAFQNLTCNYILDTILISPTAIELIGISKKISFFNKYIDSDIKLNDLIEFCENFFIATALQSG